MNRLIMQGVLTRDPDFRVTESGTSFTRVNISVTEGKTKKRTDYFNVVCFFENAEKVANSYKKGDLIYFDGKLQNNNYEKDGKKVYQDRILVENIFEITLQNEVKEKSDTLSDDELPF